MAQTRRENDRCQYRAGTPDSDLVGPIQKVRRLFPSKRIVAVFPPGRHSAALKRITAYTFLGRDVLLRSVFPNEVIKPDGFVLRRPTSWR